ncbi:hypothetical protein ACTFIZ_006319 [Dictyostelium cf. discoideum]
MTTKYDYLFEFYYFINNHFERVKNPNLFKIDSLISIGLEFPKVIGSYLVDYLSRLADKINENKLIAQTCDESIIESKECQEIIQRVYDKFKIKINENIINQTEQQIKDYSTQCDNMFTSGFIIGDIIICQLILKHYPNLFRITPYALTMAIKADKIHIIKFYYHNNNDNLIINLKDDQSLLDHLKSELLNHQDYKFDINWLN